MAFNLFSRRGGGEKFFPLFKEQSALIVKAAALLAQILKEESYEKKSVIVNLMKRPILILKPIVRNSMKLAAVTLMKC